MRDPLRVRAARSDGNEVKAQRLLRMLHTGEVYAFRSVLVLPMGLATYCFDVAPRGLYWAVPALKSEAWVYGAMELLVKLHDPESDYHTARILARHLRAIRRAGVSLRGLRVKGYRSRATKYELGHPRERRSSTDRST